MPDFLETHDRFLDAWAGALASGSAQSIEPFLDHGYHGTFATAAQETSGFDAADALAGISESAAVLKGARQAITARVVGRRDDHSACVFYAKTIHVGGSRIGAFVVEDWLRADDGVWRLCRGAVEHGVLLPGEDEDPAAT